MAPESAVPEQAPGAVVSTTIRPRPVIVGIGSSAGGLESLKLVLPGLPTDLGLCYVVLQHLAPNYRSLLAEILGSWTPMQVREVRDGDVPAPDSILVTPPNAHIEFDGARFRLVQPDPQSLPRPSINRFFASLAETLGERAVGVILSGTGSDGSAGLLQMQLQGAAVFVQEPMSSRYNGMPEAAIRLVGHDGTFVAEDIGPAINAHCGGVIVESHLAPIDGQPPRRASKSEMQLLFELIRRRSNIDFNDYKDGTLLRRLDRRMKKNSVSALRDYLELCRSDPTEIDRLVQDTLISVTSFWRDGEAFDALARAIHDLVQQKSAEDPIRVWVTGCATGEEAYSVLIAFAEALGDSITDRTLQIFATDLDQDALTLARRGVYSVAALAGLSQERIARFFTPLGPQFEFSRMLRERIVFSRHDLTRDPPFPRLDLISCRNVLIYLKSETQDRVMRSFHYALRPAALLFLGQSESVQGQEALFTSVGGQTIRLYSRAGGTTTTGLEFGQPLGSGSMPPPAPVMRWQTPVDPEIQLLRKAADLYLPPCVLLDERWQVLQIHGDISPFFTLRPGTQTFDVLSLVRTEIEVDLRLLCSMADGDEKSRHAEIVLGRGRQRQSWRMQMHTFTGTAMRRRSLLAFVRKPSRRRTGDAEESLSEQELSELSDVRERLKGLIEQLESSNSEMQALNEEVQATNEELQASNEELEAANEELQATNQELNTVNGELNQQWKNYQQLSEELQSVLNSADLPMLVIDMGQNIRRFNDPAAQLFHLGPGSEGLPLATIFRPAGMPDLSGHVTHAQASASPLVVNLPTTEDGREFVLHVAHNVLGGQRRGMVLTLVDNSELARAERQTRRVEKQLLSLMTHGSALVAIKDATGRYEFVNERFARFFDLEASLLIGRTDQQCLPAAVAAQMRSGDIDVLRQGELVERDEILNLPGGLRQWWISRFALFDDQGAVGSVCLQAIDLTRWKAIDEQLRIASRVIDVTTEGVVITDAQQTIVRVNRAFSRITGYSAEEANGHTPRLLSSGRHNKAFYAAMWEQIARNGSWQGEIWNKRKDGRLYPQWMSISVLTDEQQRVTQYVGVFSDISELTESQERIRMMATHDALTGLPNRALLMDRLQHAIESSRRQQRELALCFLDLDGFKAINDSLGHEAGDEMLRIAARRISEHIRQSDTLARLGGDEFVILLENTSRHDCLQTMERLCRAMVEPLMLRDSLLTTSASIGLALFPDDAQDAEALMRNADAAMYRAKRAGRSRYEFFSTEVGESAKARLQLESGLRQALKDGELFLDYQPQVDLVTLKPMGVEALLRWRTASGELVAPSVFLPIAEETVLIDLIGNWVLETAIAQLAEWRQRGHLLDLRLSINLSLRQLRDRQFPERLQALLMLNRVPADRIVLELTENTLQQLGDSVRTLLTRLHGLGLQISLDDFGTGYSSLAHLRQLPLDELKIDRSFVANMLDRREDREIVAAVLGLASTLGLRVVAEGVEDQGQLDHFRHFAPAPLIQGFRIARPMPGVEFLPWALAQGR